MSGMMSSYLSNNFLEGKRKTILSPEEGAAATLEAGVTAIQSPGWKPAVTSSATPMPLPGGVSAIPSSTASAIKVEKSKPIEIVSAKAATQADEEQQALVAQINVEESAAKKKKLIMLGVGAGALLLLLNN